MQARWLASGHYLAAVPDDALLSLTTTLKSACRMPFRRIDRFVQLALLGSARCTRGRTLDADAGIYLASALGPLASNIRVQEDMLKTHARPRPFDFINTLGGSAGFYVASNLGLHGPSQFLGSAHALLDAVATALTDLAAGAVPQALIGVVEEVPLPLATQRQRLHVPADTLLGEGSHWWLLDHPASFAPDDRRLTLRRHADVDALSSQLEALQAAPVDVLLSNDLAPGLAHTARRHFPQAMTVSASPLPHHASGDAAWLADTLARDASRNVVLIDNHWLLGFGA